MNERIEKLLDEAELDIVWDQDNPDYKWVEGSEESLLKFAELIVRECIDCAVWVGKSNHNPVEPIHTAHAVKRRIEKHFGVKE